MFIKYLLTGDTCCIILHTYFCYRKMYQNIVVKTLKEMHSIIEIKYVICCE